MSWWDRATGLQGCWLPISMVPFVLLRMCFLSLLLTHPTPRAVLVLGKHLGHFNLCSAHIRVFCA